MYCIKFPGIGMNEELNLIRTAQEIKEKVGILKRMVKSGKSTLLVEVSDEAQVRRLENIKRIADEAAIVEPHKTLNDIKEVVKSKALS